MSKNRIKARTSLADKNQQRKLKQEERQKIVDLMTKSERRKFAKTNKVPARVQKILDAEDDK